MSGFDTSQRARPSVYVQWQGTNACFDFDCDCGRSSHFDGYNASLVKCVGCGAVWEMPFVLFPRKADPASYADCPDAVQLMDEKSL